MITVLQHLSAGSNLWHLQLKNLQILKKLLRWNPAWKLTQIWPEWSRHFVWWSDHYHLGYEISHFGYWAFRAGQSTGGDNREQGCHLPNRLSYFCGGEIGARSWEGQFCRISGSPRYRISKLFQLFCCSSSPALFQMGMFIVQSQILSTGRLMYQLVQYSVPWNMIQILQNLWQSHYNQWNWSWSKEWVSELPIPITMSC